MLINACLIYCITPEYRSTITPNNIRPKIGTAFCPNTYGTCKIQQDEHDDVEVFKYLGQKMTGSVYGGRGGEVLGRGWVQGASNLQINI